MRVMFAFLGAKKTTQITNGIRLGRFIPRALLTALRVVSGLLSVSLGEEAVF